MMRSSKSVMLLLPLTMMMSSAAMAGYKLVPANTSAAVATPQSTSLLMVTPSREWNSLSTKIGKNAISWTIDGLSLNELTFYTGVANDQTLFREVNKSQKPLPRFNATMLAPDVAQLFEQSYRIAVNTSLFSVDLIEPANFAGHQGFRFAFGYTVQDEEVKRKGEAVGAIIDGKLFMITYVAPAIHYFDRDLAAYRSIADSAKIGAPLKRR